MNKPCEWCIGLFTNDTGTLTANQQLSSFLLLWTFAMVNNNNHYGGLANSTIRKVLGLEIKSLRIIHFAPKLLFSSRSQTPVWERHLKEKLLFAEENLTMLSGKKKKKGRVIKNIGEIRRL